MRVCGFGLAAAGAGAAHAIATHPADAEAGVVLVGAAGTYDPDRFAIGTAIDARGPHRRHRRRRGGTGPARLRRGRRDRLGGADGELFSWPRRRDRAAAPSERGRHPSALAEEMEGFAVAVAAGLFGVPLRIVRGASNRAGDRNHAEWRMAEALAAARARVLEPA